MPHERGKCLPDVSLYKDLCDILGITLNEFFAREKIKDEEFKKKVDDNLLNALENNSFTLKEKIKYYNDKWEKEHIFEIILVIIVVAGFIIYGFIKDNRVQFIFMVLGLIWGVLCGVFEKNRKQAYIERNAYRQINKKK